MNMKNKKFAIALILIVVAVASVSAASYGNRQATHTLNTQNLGRGRVAVDSQTCLVTGEEVVAGRGLYNEDRGSGMYGYRAVGADLDELCLVTGEAPLEGNRLGSANRMNASQGGGMMRWSR